MRHRPLSLAAVLVASTLMLGACGGGGSDDSEDDSDEVPPLAAPVNLGTDRIGVIRPEWGANGETNTDYGTSTAAIDGVACQSSEAYHVHSHLSIFLDGVQLAIPSFVGITSSCFYSLHTHDASGKIHIENDRPTTYTLGQVFSVWKQPLSEDNVAGLTGKPVVVYVKRGDEVTRYEGDPGDIELASRLEITIQVGSTLDAIPTYNWSGN